MINEVTVAGFKRFHGTSFTFAPLTVLTGLNGSGKTTLIQALLLARESSTRDHATTVRLNEFYGMSLGTAEDVRNWNSADRLTVRIKSDDAERSEWTFTVPFSEALFLDIESRPGTVPLALRSTPRAFTYLAAERLGPRSVLGAAPLPTDELEVGSAGEHCAQLVAEIGNRPLSDASRAHPDHTAPESRLLKYQVEHWICEVARPIEIDAVPFPGGTVTALRFRTPGSEWVRAPNMGFGVSYALPVVLAGLIAQTGGLLVVENPEAHLHPSGQSRMGVFLAWLAARGVQVVVETHSDHVLNGMRRAIGEHGYLGHDQAVVHFFESGEEVDPVVHELTFTPIGGISHWPSGFFDQYQIDVAALGRVRRRRR